VTRISEGGENFVNDDKEKELSTRRGNRFEGEEEEEVRSWTKRVDFLCLKGVILMDGCLGRRSFLKFKT